MRFKTFGNTNAKISEISIGTWGIGGAGWGEINGKESVAAIDAMLESGVNVIDTAPVYGFFNPSADDLGFGRAEVILGEALKGKRDSVYLITKCGLNFDREKGPQSMYKSLVEDEIIGGCEQSLKRLQTDCIDMLFAHWPDEKTPIEEVVGSMEKLIKAGKIKSYGLSNFTQEQVIAANSILPVGAVQMEYSMVNRKFEDALKAAYDNNIGTMAYATFGAGVLTGAYRTLPDFGQMDTRNTFYPYFKEPKFSQIQSLLKIMDEVAAQYGATPSEVAINWSTQKQFISTAILGVSKVKHANQNAKAFDWKLTNEDMAKLDNAVDEFVPKD